MDFALDPDMRCRRCYVLFRKSYLRAWWSRFTVPGLEHCSVIEEMDFANDGLASVDCFIYTDYCYGLLVHQIHWGDAREMIAKALSSCEITAVAVIEVEKSHQWGYIPFGLFTCVTIVKAVLGLRGWKIQTPQSLFRHLERRGVTIIRGMCYE